MAEMSEIVEALMSSDEPLAKECLQKILSDIAFTLDKTNPISISRLIQVYDPRLKKVVDGDSIMEQLRKISVGEPIAKLSVVIIAFSDYVYLGFESQSGKIIGIHKCPLRNGSTYRRT